MYPGLPETPLYCVLQNPVKFAVAIFYVDKYGAKYKAKRSRKSVGKPGCSYPGLLETPLYFVLQNPVQAVVGPFSYFLPEI